MKGACAKVPLRDPGVRQEVLQLRDAILKKSREESTTAVYARYQNNYVACCEQMGIAAWPPSYESVTRFMSVHCKAGLSANSLGTLESALKAQGLVEALKATDERKRVPWMSETEERALKLWKRGAHREYGKPPNRRPGLTVDLLQKMVLVTNFDDLKEVQHLTMAWVAHDALLRHRELAALEVTDVWWDPGSETCRLTITDSKCNKGKDKVKEVVHLIPYGDVSGYALLKYLWNRRQLASRPAGVFVFEALGGLGSGPRAAAPKPAYVDWMRLTLQKVGVRQAGAYTGHSCRAGGATDLFRAGIPARLIQLAGRWKSEAYLIYIRDHPVARARATFQGFERVSRSAEVYVPSYDGGTKRKRE